MNTFAPQNGYQLSTDSVVQSDSAYDPLMRIQRAGVRTQAYVAGTEQRIERVWAIVGLAMTWLSVMASFSCLNRLRIETKVAN